MTEQEWLECSKLEKMLEFLTVNHFDKAHGRKIHLFACGCVRRVWHLLVDVRSQEAFLTAERFAELEDEQQEELEDELDDVSERAWEAAESTTSPAANAASRAAADLATTRCWDAAWDGYQTRPLLPK